MTYRSNGRRRPKPGENDRGPWLKAKAMSDHLGLSVKTMTRHGCPRELVTQSADGRHNVYRYSVPACNAWMIRFRGGGRDAA